MFSFLRNILLFFLFAINTIGSAVDVYQPEMSTDSTEQYQYGVWTRNNGNNFIVQTMRSSDFGNTWTNPIITPADGGSPNLSDDGKTASSPKIVTNSTGQYVYAIWRRFDGKYYIAQIVKSSDYGATWVYPNSTTGDGGPPNLSDDGGTAYDPKIVTDLTGKYVYAIWRRGDVNRNYIVQTAFSSDYGANWIYPTTTTGNQGSPNLSDSGRSANYTNIATNSTGQYIYAIWSRYNDLNMVVQVAKSSDYGITWTNPTSTTGSEIPNLSDDNEDASDPIITTNSTGQYVYAIWERDKIIQVAISSDYGATWVDPTATTGDGGSPNLSNNSDDARFSYIKADSTGQYVYAIWAIEDDDSYKIVQTATSFDYGMTWINPTITKPPHDVDLPKGPTIDTNLTKKYTYAVWFNPNNINTIAQTADKLYLLDGIYLIVLLRKYSMQSIFQNEYTNKLYWEAVPSAQSYRVYVNSMENMIYEGRDLEYSHHRINLKDSKTYFITWLNSQGIESNPSEITIP